MRTIDRCSTQLPPPEGTLVFGSPSAQPASQRAVELCHRYECVPGCSRRRHNPSAVQAARACSSSRHSASCRAPCVKLALGRAMQEWRR
eukprot:1378684-Prymnesium_polylepis.1